MSQIPDLIIDPTRLMVARRPELTVKRCRFEDLAHIRDGDGTR
jgi:hypothetical protein